MILKALKNAGDRFWFLVAIVVCLELYYIYNQDDESDNIKKSLHKLYDQNPMTLLILIVLMMQLMALSTIK